MGQKIDGYGIGICVFIHSDPSTPARCVADMDTSLKYRWYKNAIDNAFCSSVSTMKPFILNPQLLDQDSILARI
jgi:hypothetical protein